MYALFIFPLDEKGDFPAHHAKFRKSTRMITRKDTIVSPNRPSTMLHDFSCTPFKIPDQQ